MTEMPNLKIAVKQKNILLTAVGNRDPFDKYSGNKGPILEAVSMMKSDAAWKHLFPDYVYLLHTADKKNTADELSKLISEYDIMAECLEMATTDPTDFTLLLNQMGSRAFEVTSSCPNDKLIVLVSPGTSQMNAVWLVLGNEGRLNATFLQKKESQFGGELKRINFKPLFESETIKIAIQLFQRYDFGGAALNFDKLEKSHNERRKDVSLFLAKLCSIYAHWDSFNYDLAKEELEEINTSFLGNTGIESEYVIATLNDQAIALDKLCNDILETRIIDMLCSAQRLRKVNRYMDSLWRCTTAYEIMLRRTYESSVGTTLMGEKTVYGLQNQLLASRHRGMQNIKNCSLLRPLSDLREDRNKLIHFGNNPNLISKIETKGSQDQTARDPLDVTQTAILKFFMLPENSINNYPMSTHSLKKVGSQISALLKGHE